MENHTIKIVPIRSVSLFSYLNQGMNGNSKKPELNHKENRTNYSYTAYCFKIFVCSKKNYIERLTKVPKS